VTVTGTQTHLAKATLFVASMLVAICGVGTRQLVAQNAPEAGVQKIILDSDIGDDIDDAFALALAETSPKLQLLGVTTAWGNTSLRAQLAARFLKETGHGDIPVFAGPATHTRSPFTQVKWAEAGPKPAEGWPDAVDFILDTIRRNPGEITLVSIAPFTNIGAAIQRDPATFRKLRCVVIMGGSVRRGYGDLGYLPDHGPDPEYNVLMDVPAAQKLFTSGVPLYVMPLDATQLKLDEVLRSTLFSQDTRITNALVSLYEEWTASTRNPTPTLFDAMAVAAAIDPALCPTQPMHLEVDDQGYTREKPGAPNANVCLASNSDRFFHFYIPAVLAASQR
jgi:purine nucleosidase